MTATALKSVDLVRPNGRPANGLVSVHGRRSKSRLDEEAVVQEAAHLKHVTHVFFRRFSDERSSQVAAFVVDNSDEHATRDDLAHLHCDVWRQGIAPLLYVAWPTQVDVLTCARGPDFWDERSESCQYQPLEELQDATRTAAEIDAALQEKRSRFSARRLADGTFWDDPRNGKLAAHKKGAHQLLIQAVVEADEALGGEGDPILRRLLMLTVLIKYLEDRRVFPQTRNWFGQFSAGATTFLEVLQQGSPDEVRSLLRALEQRFNGDVFALPEAPKLRLTKDRLRTFAQLVDETTVRGQRYLWEQYSFKHLPAEVISHLYLRFVTGGHGVVYTPPFLASLLLDYAMPYDKLSGKERVLDPACGSGVFLVGAFRRLVAAWRSRNQWRRPKVHILKSILANSIFGIDLDGDAVDLAVFSLALAVCDFLKPKVIWKDLRFDPLRGRNIVKGDFFGYIKNPDSEEFKAWPEKFDVVVGNPPFESQLSEAGEALNGDLRPQRGELPDKQAAYLFLEQGFRALAPTGNLCLVQQHGFLHNTGTTAFCQRIIRNHRVSAVLDFVSIRELFGKPADTKAVAIVAHPTRPRPGGWITHATFRRTASVLERIGFELDHYDRHRIPQQVAENDPLVWRINLLGGGRLHEISRRLRGLRTLEEYIEPLRSQGWDYGEGFIAAKTGTRKPAPFLTDSPLLPAGAFKESGIDESKMDTVRETHFRSAYTKSRYASPLVLIKELDSLPIAFWDKGILAYSQRIVGIHAPTSQRRRLKDLHRSLSAKHAFYQFCCALHGSQALVGKATSITKQDIDALPYPEAPSELDFAFWEDALQEDVLNYMAEFVRLGQESALLNEAAGGEALDAYAKMFCRMLGSVYTNLKAHSPIRLDGLICQPFYFGDRPEVEWVSDGSAGDLQSLIYDDRSYESLRTVRIVRFCMENVILLVKPDRLRYWIRSTAIRDADETLVDLHEQGY